MKQFLAALVAILPLVTMPLLADEPRQDDVGAAAGAATNEPAELELDKLMMADDAALDEINTWIQDNSAYAGQGAGEAKAQLNQRIVARLKPVRDGYEDFLKRHPKNARGFLAYGSFLNDIGDEEGAEVQYEKSRQLDPKNPAAWNDLANYYGEHGPVTNAFAYYAKAAELNSNEPVYYENWGTTVYLYRKDAEQFYGINEAQVFDKALALYRQAIALDPKNFTLRTDYAESYYEIRPLPVNDALAAWTNALNQAQTDVEREGVLIHLARVNIAGDRLADAQADLNVVTNATYDAIRSRLQRNLNRAKENRTNSPSSSSGQKMP